VEVPANRSTQIDPQKSPDQGRKSNLLSFIICLFCDGHAATHLQAETRGPSALAWRDYGMWSVNAGDGGY
jgi:hypothetical protein